MNTLAKVLIVDDSAYVRKMVTQMLSRSPFLDVVATARDGREALELAAELQPDVITCDLNMPEMNGVAFVQAQMAARPTPIVIMSVINGAAEQVLAALDAGAIDFVQKPTALASERLLDVADELVAKVKVAAEAPMRRRPWSIVQAPLPVIAQSGSHAFDVLVIGISTGGPQALKLLIPQLPAAFPIPVAVVLHMPPGYTEPYAAKLREVSSLIVKEAAEGDAVVPGTVFIAPAGRHLTFRRAGNRVTCHVDLRPLDSLHRPSADVLFRSAADVYGAKTLAVVMTGMGADGRDGSAWIKANGGRVMTESESSCVVYGMPRAVVEAGLSDATYPLDRLAEGILRQL